MVTLAAQTVVPRLTESTTFSAAAHQRLTRRSAPLTHVMTVRGPIDPAGIGPTMAHEHIFLDARWSWSPGHAGPYTGTEPFTPDLAPLARWDGRAFREAMIISRAADLAVVESELDSFLQAAPRGCIVELSSTGLNGDPEGLLLVSKALDLDIVAGIGWYVHAAHDERVEQATVDDLEASLTAQVQDGIGTTGIRPGIIGELGTSHSLQPCEERVLRAAARTAGATGLAINVHCDPPPLSVVHAILDVLEDEGHDLTRTYLSHLDEISDLDYHQSVVDRGVVVGFDSFGQDGYFSADFKSRSDLAKMRTAAALIDRGHAGQLVLGQDVCSKKHLRAFGGFGFDHVVRRVVPRLQEVFGVSDDVVQTMLVDTPRRLLTIG